MCHESASESWSLAIGKACSEGRRILPIVELAEVLELMSAQLFILACGRCSARPIYFAHLVVDDNLN